MYMQNILYIIIELKIIIIKYSLIINNKISPILQYQNPMHQNFKQNIIAKSLIKFIDIILDLYSPVPYQIRNQMRILQSTLLYGHVEELKEYIENLKEKLTIKEKYKLHNTQHCYSQAQLHSGNRSQNKIIRNCQQLYSTHDPDKQNKYYLNNLKTNNSQNLKPNSHSFNSTKVLNSTLNTTLPQALTQKPRKISAIWYINKEQDVLYQNNDNISNTNYGINKKNSAREPTEIGRNSSRNILKIIKKSKSGKDKLSVMEKSVDGQVGDTGEKGQLLKLDFQALKSNIQFMVDVMEKNNEIINSQYGDYFRLNSYSIQTQ